MSEDDRIRESIRQHGWHAIGVQARGQEPGMLYTVGLCATFDHPEIVVCGLAPNVAYGLVADMIARIKTGHGYRDGGNYSDVIEGQVVAVRVVHQTHVLCRLGYAMAYYRRERTSHLLTAVQLVWPDRAGKLPGDPACDKSVVASQPRLDDALAPVQLRALLDRPGSTWN
jgi:hypothetical protein